jgi:hypothetical protein
MRRLSKPAEAVTIQDAEIMLRPRASLVGGELVEVCSLTIVLRQASTPL